MSSLALGTESIVYGIASFPVVIADSVYLFHYVISLNKMASSSRTVAKNDFSKFFQGQ